MIKFTIRQLNKNKLFVKFVISGATAFLVNMLALFLWHDLVGTRVEVSVSLAYIMAFGVSFSMQKYWTFRDRAKENMPKQVTLHLIVSSIGLVINTLLMKVLVDMFEFNIYWSQAFCSLVIGLGSFSASKYVTFRQAHKDISRKFLLDQSGKGMNVVIATGIFPPEPGGPANYTNILRQDLPALGYQVKLLTYGDQQTREFAESAGFKDIYIISRHYSRPYKYLLYCYYVWKLAVWADVVYAQGPVTSGLPVCVACYLRSKRYLLKIVGDYAWEQGQQRYGVRELLDQFQRRRYGWQVELLRHIQKRVARRAFKVITPSCYLKGIIAGWGIESDKIRVIYNSVAVPEIVLTKEVMKAQCGLRGDIILTMGRLVNWKGFEALIEIMPKLLAKNPNFRLIIVGSGQDQKKLESKIKLGGLEGKVILTGSMKQSHFWNLMRASEMFVLNTGYEGLSHVLIEAMSLKMPIITTPIGGNVELIQDRETGLLVDYNDKVELEEAILELWQNKELAKGLSEKAYAFSRRFNRETMVKELLQEFDFFKKRKSDKRNILSISAYGRSLTNTGGAYSGAITRQIDYGTCVDKYVIICPGDDEDVIELSPNVRIYPVPAKSKLSFLVKSIAKAGWVIKKEKITGLICDNPFDAGIIGNILKVKYDMPLVVCSMGQMVGNKYYFKERKSNYLKNILGHINLRLADMIRVSTDAEVEQMKRCRLKTDKIFKSPCYIDFSDFEGGERDEKFRQSLLSGKFKKIVLFVGRFALAKDLATLIKGFKQAGKSYSDTLLVMVGDGSEMGMAKELIESEGLSEQVKLVGKVPNDQIAKYYRAADIFLATSLYEGICLVLQEAAICRLPIVATEFAGAVDLIKPGINGYLAPVGDHMAIGEQLKKLLALSEQDLKNMGSKNHDLVKAEYTRTGALEKFRKMFDGLL